MCTSLIDFDRTGVPTAALDGLGDHFTEEEIWRTIAELNPNKARGPDGFTTKFFRVAWPVIRPDIMAAFNALALNSRSFHAVNDALLVLLPKSPEASAVKDYGSISLIRCIGKLFSKVLLDDWRQEFRSWCTTTRVLS